jgi:hypothetical protein
MNLGEDGSHGMNFLERQNMKTRNLTGVKGCKLAVEKRVNERHRGNVMQENTNVTGFTHKSKK